MERSYVVGGRVFIGEGGQARGKGKGKGKWKGKSGSTSSVMLRIRWTKPQKTRPTSQLVVEVGEVRDLRLQPLALADLQDRLTGRGLSVQRVTVHNEPERRWCKILLAVARGEVPQLSVARSEL